MASAGRSQRSTRKRGKKSPKATSPSYRLIDEESQVGPALRDIRGRGPMLAVDCEALNLGRRGELSLVSVATAEQAFLFDIKALGKGVFDGGLRDLLQDEGIEKLMFDCRADSDCLWHKFEVKLDNVLDLQLLEIILREERGEVTLADHPRVRSLLSCFETYVDDDSDLSSVKERGRGIMDDDAKAWLRRPLKGALLKYAAGDVRGLRPLYLRLVADCPEGALSRARSASANYVDFYRAKTSRSYDKYEGNAFLPMYVVPPKGSLRVSRASHNKRCCGCSRLFLRSDFSKTQLRNGTPRCPVCKLVKEGIDKQKNWEAQKSKRNESYEHDLCDESDDGYCYHYDSHRYYLGSNSDDDNYDEFGYHYDSIYNDFGCHYDSKYDDFNYYF